MGRKMSGDVMNEMATYGDDAPYAGMWNVTRGNGAVRFVREGYVRIVVSWIGGDAFVIAWQYDAGDWRATQVTRDMVGLEAHMTMNAMTGDAAARVE